MLTRAWDARPSLLVVDLETRGGARRVLEWRARQMVLRLGAFGGRGNRLAQVLLHLPEGVGPSPGWPAEARVIRTAERISPSRLLEIHERAFARSFEVARGAIGEVFPEVCGVGLGALNLKTIQTHLASFSIIASALGDVLDEREIGACHILSADVGYARALERQVVGRVATVCTWPPRSLLQGERWARSKWASLPLVHARKAEQEARTAMATRLREQRLEHGAQVLVVAESTPIAHMFAVVEAALARAGVGSVVRLDFSGGAARIPGAAAVVCNCGTPGALGLRAGPFGAQWGEAERKLRSRQAFPEGNGAEEALSLEGLLGYLYVSKFDAQARHLWAADTALELLRPAVVLVGNDRWWGGQAFVQLARRRGIPSVCVQDGVAGDHPSWWWLAADHMAATNEQVVEMLVRHGVPPERCHVTGQPRYDPVAGSGPDGQRTARASLGLHPSRFAVLFGGQWIHDRDYVGGVVSALLAVPGIHVMLRPHPSDRRDLWERVVREYGQERMTLHRTGDSLTLVRACDALVTQHSTVAVEAALLGKPVITTEFGGFHGPAPVIPDGIATQVRGLEDLTREVQRLATAMHAPRLKPSQSLQVALAALVGPVDGHAAERVGELVAEMLRRAPHAVPAAVTW